MQHTEKRLIPFGVSLTTSGQRNSASADVGVLSFSDLVEAPAYHILIPENSVRS